MTLANRSPARWLDAESSDLIREFWLAAGAEEPWPRSLERPLALALPVTVIKLARLHLHEAEHWLRARGVALSFGGGQGERRAVHGCIVAHAGHGFLFVDATDSPAELRFTVAHEIGHFLADHLLPRRQAERRFGAEILPVLNGQRTPTQLERFSSALSGVRLGSYQSYLPRSDSADGGLDLWKVEGRADRIGAALLAPPDLVLLAATGPDHATRLRRAVQALTGTFGFPPTAAARYAQALLQENGLGPTWSESLRRPAWI
jgi:hypothetical protein